MLKMYIALLLFCNFNKLILVMFGVTISSTKYIFHFESLNKTSSLYLEVNEKLRCEEGAQEHCCG